MNANTHHNNYKLMCADLMRELAEAKQNISDNNEFYGGQLMTLNAKIALLEQENKRLNLRLTRGKLH